MPVKYLYISKDQGAGNIMCATIRYVVPQNNNRFAAPADSGAAPLVL
jgi:hypothetical protein